MRKKIGGSKRKTCALKYKIKKRVNEHKRRYKKEAKRAKVNGLTIRNIGKVTPIPNSFPNKKFLLQEQELIKEINNIHKQKDASSGISFNRKKNKGKEEIPDLIEE